MIHLEWSIGYLHTGCGVCGTEGLTASSAPWRDAEMLFNEFPTLGLLLKNVCVW